MNNAERVAMGIVAVLGWDLFDGLDMLDTASDEVIEAFVDILNEDIPPPPDMPKETVEHYEMLTRMGIRRATRIRDERAITQWENEGGQCANFDPNANAVMNSDQR